MLKKTPIKLPHVDAFDATIAALAHAIERRTVGMENCVTPIPNLSLFRRETPGKPTLCLIEPSIVLVAQGAKQMLLGAEAYPYGTHHFLIASLTIPANSQVITATPETPCLGLGFKLDLQIMAELIAQGGLTLPAAGSKDSGAGMGIGTVTQALIESFNRLLQLLDEPSAIPVLAQQIQREIHYRLLLSDQAARLWQITSMGSQSRRVAGAIDWLKLNYAEPLRIENLAAHVQMSPSTLHHHFRQLTAMSPLQYQKWLRLNEARRLMLNDGMDAAAAAFQVGYESPSQYSREYTRLFGAPPKRDIEVLRTQQPVSVNSD